MHENSNCCQLCKEKNLSQKYYLCKTCSNIIICKNCFEKHNKDDNIEKLNKIDSLCKKHFNPIESYCDICKEHKCSYCIPEHEEEHKNKEYLIRDKMIKKHKIDNFKKKFNNISENMQIIEKEINEIINELKNKIELLLKLKNKFFETLNIKIKFTDLVYKNYIKKYKDIDLNYYIIKNLENQIEFGLKEFKIKKEDKLENKIEEILSYLDSNLNNHFNTKSEEYFYEENNNYNNDIKINAIDINYTIKQEFNLSNMIGYLDFNDELYAIYNNSLVQFFSKKNNKFKFEINEIDLNGIKSCQKNEKNKILVITNNNLIFIQILENSDYIILNKYSDSIQIFEFNDSLDLIYSKGNYIYFSLFPNYSEEKVLTDYEYSYINKFQFINDNLFFIFQNDSISSFSIINNKAQKLNSTNQIKINTKLCEIVDLNNFFMR